MTEAVFEKDSIIYAKTEIPSGWRTDVTTYDSYYGKGYPFGFKLSCDNETRSCVMEFANPLVYEEDSRYEYPANTLKTTNFGVLLRPFITCERFIDETAARVLKECTDVKLMKTFSFSGDANASAKRTARLNEEGKKRYANSNDTVFNGAYFEALTKIYSYTYKNHERVRAICAAVEAETTTEYLVSEIPASYKADPMIWGFMKSSYDYINERGEGVKLFRKVTRWNMKERFSLDAPKERFDELYKTDFPAFIEKFCWNISVVNELKKGQQQIDSRNAQSRAKQDEKDEHERRMREIRRENDRLESQRRREAMNRIWETQRQTSDIINDTYERNSRIRDNANRKWSEAYNNRYTYVDHYGSEYTAEGYGKYAFSDGWRVITTDDPEGPGYGWEEVYKKY